MELRDVNRERLKSMHLAGNTVEQLVKIFGLPAYQVYQALYSRGVNWDKGFHSSRKSARLT